MDQRASDADRERAAETLRHAAGEGRLTVEELDERLQATFRSTTSTELERLTGDIVTAPAEGQRTPVLSSAEGERRIVSIMGGSDRSGRWTVARSCRVLNVMGGSDVDLNDAALAGEEVELRVISIMGGSTIRVPEGLNVEVSQVAIMGGNNIKIGDPTPDPGGPVLRLRLVSIMGGTDVKRGRKVSWRERLNRRTGPTSP